MQRAMVNNINTSRDQSGLPQLKDWRSFYDIDYRNQAYKGKQASTGNKIDVKASNGKTYSLPTK